MSWWCIHNPFNLKKKCKKNQLSFGPWRKSDNFVPKKRNSIKNQKKINISSLIEVWVRQQDRTSKHTVVCFIPRIAVHYVKNNKIFIRRPHFCTCTKNKNLQSKIPLSFKVATHDVQLGVHIFTPSFEVHSHQLCTCPQL